MKIGTKFENLSALIKKSKKNLKINKKASARLAFLLTPIAWGIGPVITSTVTEPIGQTGSLAPALLWRLAK